ncbi:hypothetical protein [Alicyclobacillus sp. ALC3]|uniref:hypothetical protein n=1 Tax=Alicyclobacillus sp. ALC3 TaxID=2796143 RepID=UPI00237857AF|nr:hypothetical protein [Alicyclobacillus sp. ALC3]WDL99210.1 hypothetical protein JC200_11515 [Alicyclobacillus sp. ALC3]
MASGVNNVSRQIGISFGIAFLGAMLTDCYNIYIENQILALHLPHLSAAVKTQIIAGLQKAGTIAASTGLKTNPNQPNPYARSPFFPDVQTAVRIAFIHGMTDMLLWASGFLAVGALSALFLIRRRDMYYLGHDTSTC